jgi:hypothetical protein
MSANVLASKVKKTEFAGMGSMMQLLGVVLIVVGFGFGLVVAVFFGGIGLLLLVAGGVKANVLLCSECRGKVEKAAKVCPHCRARFNQLDSDQSTRDEGESWKKTMRGG